MPMSRWIRPTAWLAAGLVLAVGTSPAHGWGPRGHRVATKIAEARLTPEAKAAISALLLEGDTLAELASWADHEGHEVEPKSATWHYINVPITAAHVDHRFALQPDGVVNRIGHFRRLLADPKTPKKERTRALLFFMHFIEDVHQPLHVGDNSDRGGNLTQVQYFKDGDNLHRVWDSGIIEDASRDDRAWLKAIDPLLTAKNIAEWSKGDAESWADESLQDAKLAYFFPKGAKKPIATGTTLGRDYSEAALPIIRLRLAKAGVRLANELNAVFAEGKPAGNAPKAKPSNRKAKQPVGAG